MFLLKNHLFIILETTVLIFAIVLLIMVSIKICFILTGLIILFCYYKKKIKLGSIIIFLVFMLKLLNFENLQRNFKESKTIYSKFLNIPHKAFDMFLFGSLDPENTKKSLNQKLNMSSDISTKSKIEEIFIDDFRQVERSSVSAEDQEFMTKTFKKLEDFDFTDKYEETKNKLKNSYRLANEHSSIDEKSLDKNKKFKFIYGNEYCKLFITDEDHANLFNQFYLQKLTTNDEKIYVPCIELLNQGTLFT